MSLAARCLRRARGVCLVILLASLAIVPGALAGAFPALDLDERLERAVDVFVGEVTEVRFERRGDLPWTLVTFRVSAWVLVDGVPGELGPLERTLAFLGGSASGTAPRQVAGFPDFVVGERYLVASYGDDAAGASPLVGVTQGAWRDDLDVWRDAFGDALGVDAAGRPRLSEAGDPESVWLPALRERVRELRGAP